ncbi:hypothetical protein C8A05DRAFT_30129 [Staphylotrichum tortipilum]|uniref:Hemerythrin-like domain-containing protein n=1 Tax=Staphylotrichum tortipilum TaxID=2831512 RepID=A0AAN6MSY0_9PEZI|nr:hypothetical protein C8A05DRAFT_30129 [Staphylotrichum longicolle]
MAPVYADRPFSLISTPIFLANNNDRQPDMFDKLASEMSLVHNMLIRGLNSIYLQAPHIQPADTKPFAKYILGWCHGLHSHHDGEETMFFPAVEKMTGEPGVMDTNIEQHKRFHDGLEQLQAYADDVVVGKEAYDGGRVVAIIDAFGPALIQHLTDEIPTILGLRKYGDKMAALPKLFDEEGEKAMKELGVPATILCFSNIDTQYEGGMWQSWPPAPAPVKLLMQSVFWWIYADSRKFGAVDRTGKLKHLYAVPEFS